MIFLFNPKSLERRVVLRQLFWIGVLTILATGCTDPKVPTNVPTQRTLGLNSTTLNGVTTTQLSGTGTFKDITTAVTTPFTFSTPYSGSFSVNSNDTVQFSMSVTSPSCPCTFTFSYTIGVASGPATTDSSSGAYTSPQIQLN